MLTFNDILRAESIDPSVVRLLRHQDGRLRRGAIYAAWKRRDGAFEAYQRIQRRDRFRVGDLLASFVVTLDSSTLLAGLYAVRAAAVCPEGTVDPLLGTDASGFQLYELEYDERLSPYEGRLRIEWGAGTRAWVQRASKREKPVTEIRDDYLPWPGFEKFIWDTDDLDGLYPNWAEILQTVKGVYLLVDKGSGRSYVGSATGLDNLYGRLMSYANGGSGGNVELQAAGTRNYQVSLLEAVPMPTSDERILDMETAWKQKLLSRRPFGLNAN
ncbi:MAG: GIY-YIG nuclease family protein [Dehalococcoidia bacterium]